MKFRNLLLYILCLLAGHQLLYAQATCPSYSSGTPPPAYDACVQAVFDADPFCCNTTWDGVCQGAYDPTPCAGGGGGNINMTNGSTTTCSATFFDSGGGAGNYNNGENSVYTICPSNGTDVIQAAFSTFDIESNFDFLTIYDGPNTFSPLIGTFTGTTSPGTIAATLANGGCLTFEFTSDGSVTDIGWEAAISCVPPGGGGGGCSDCSNPTTIAALPFNMTTTTCGACDNFTSFDACASLYMDGEDYVFAYTPPVAQIIDLSLTGTLGFTGLFVTAGCPNIGAACVGSSTNTVGNPVLNGVSLLAGQTYFITVSTFPAPNCTPFTININEVAPTCFDGLQNGSETGVDCGGPCPACTGPVTAGDCNQAINICTNASFSIDPSGFGTIDEVSGNNISNPLTNPNGTNAGCLLAGETNSTWMIINIASSGTLEFTFDVGGGTNYYDWIMWEYDANACSDILNNIRPPVACNWNGAGISYTGMAATVPPGGDASNFETPLNVSCGEQYLVCFSNWSSALSSVPINFFGTANIACGVFNPITVNSPTVCEGQCANLTATGANTYTWTFNPDLSSTTGGSVSACPAAAGTYTYDVTGTGSCGTGTSTATLTVLSAGDPSCILLQNQLVDFSADLDMETQKVDLLWETASEVNSSHFIIERSTNGIEFEELGQYAAAGDTDYNLHYSTVDHDPLNGVSYYRLKLFNHAGEAVYSKIVSISNLKESTKYRLFPNPATSEFSVEGIGLDQADLVIYNTLGQELSLAPSSRQENIATYETRDLAAGLYFVVIRQEGFAVTKRLLIK